MIVVKVVPYFVCYISYYGMSRYCMGKQQSSYLVNIDRNVHNEIFQRSDSLEIKDKLKSENSRRFL